MTRCAFLIPGDLGLPTGGYVYDRRVLRLLEAHGVSVSHVALPGGYPDPSPDELARTAEIVAGLAPDCVLLIDGLAYGAMPETLIAGFGRPIVALCHHPLGLEAGLTPERAQALLRSEAAALARAAEVIVTSAETRAIVSTQLGFPAGRITVAEPGVDPAPRARGTGSPVRLLAVGSLVPRKGYGDLIAALAGLVDLEWTLGIAGADDRHPEEARRLRARLAAAPALGARVELLGAVEEARLNHLYDRADVFVMTSRYEGYGMVLAEAMARGLAIVTSLSGAAAAQAPATAALKYPPGDVAALAAALRRVIESSGLRAEMARASWAFGQQLPRWDATAGTIASVLRRTAA
jgi:glycosyltransferase involved in cell wall biosynthesis